MTTPLIMREWAARNDRPRRIARSPRRAKSRPRRPATPQELVRQTVIVSRPRL